MIATIVNALAILGGSFTGLLFRDKIKQSYLDAVLAGLALCIAMVGIRSALASENTLCMIICMVVGILIGELLHIEDRLNGLGDVLKKKLVKGQANSQFTEGFVSATLLFGVGSMAILGSLEAGIHHDYSIIFSKSVMDGLIAISFAATMGIGVAFSSIAIFLYQGLLTILAGLLAPLLSEAVIAEMSGVGGLMILGIAINMLGVLGERQIHIGNMLPAIVLPVFYLPLAHWIGGILG